MASPAFGTKTDAGGSAAANVTINVPASTADGDFLIAVISKDDAGAITPPAGWNNIVDASANTFHLYISWRVASSEPASYTWTFASVWRDANMMRYTGVYTATPFDPAVPAAPTEAASANTSVTPANNIATAATTVCSFHNARLLTSWQAASATVDGVTMTVRSTNVNSEVRLMDGAKAASATPEPGKSQTYNGSAGQMKSYMLVLASLSPDQHYSPPPVFPGVFNLDARRMI